MNDLELSELERHMLEAGRREALPAELRAQMARALDGVAPATAARTGLSWGVGKLVVPVALVGLAGLGWYASQHARRPQPMAAEIAEPAPRAPAAIAQTPAALSPPPSAADAPDALGAEIALLDRARGALREHQGARAVAILSEYQHQFARGVLRPEADALQIEALLQRGSSAKAQKLAQRFVAEHPSHPLSDRVQRLFAR
jgi:hypothetical protein